MTEISIQHTAHTHIMHKRWSRAVIHSCFSQSQDSLLRFVIVLARHRDGSIALHLLRCCFFQLPFLPLSLLFYCTHTLAESVILFVWNYPCNLVIIFQFVMSSFRRSGRVSSYFSVSSLRRRSITRIVTPKEPFIHIRNILYVEHIVRWYNLIMAESHSMRL